MACSDRIFVTCIMMYAIEIKGGEKIDVRYITTGRHSSLHIPNGYP